MPDIAPIAASGRFDRKRPRPIPKNVREAISLMIVGKPDDPDCTPHDFVQAAAAVGMTPFVLRRHLERPHVRAFLLAEKRAFTAMVCAANPASLAKIRDTAVNTMSRVAAVRALEQLDEEASSRPAGSATPGVVIRIITRTDPLPASPMVDVTPRPTLPPSDEDCSDEALTR
jgi:hypothetical protein